MPVLMFKVATAKSPHKQDGKKPEEALRIGVEDSGGRLVCLHSGGGGVAYGIVEGHTTLTAWWQSSPSSPRSQAKSSAY